MKLARCGCVEASMLWFLSRFQLLRGQSKAALRRVTATPHMPTSPANQAQGASRKASSSLMCWKESPSCSNSSGDLQGRSSEHGPQQHPTHGPEPPAIPSALRSIPGKASRLSWGQGVAGPLCPGQAPGRAPHLTSTLMPAAFSLAARLQPFRECGNI